MGPPPTVQSTLDPTIDGSLGPPASGAGPRGAPDAGDCPTPPGAASLFDDRPDAAEATGGETAADDPDSLETQLAAVRAELDRQRTIVADREARCRELERTVARERRAAEHEIEYTTGNLVRSHAVAVADRDRAVAQLEEAVDAREAAVRARQRMETQRDEAIVQREVAEARRDEAIADRKEARRQRDELQAAHRTVQKQLRNAAHADASANRASAESTGSREPSQPGEQTAVVAPAADPTADAAAVPPVHTAPVPPTAHRRSPANGWNSGGHRDAEHRLTNIDLWGIRLLGGVGALCFTTLLVFIMKSLLGL